MKKFNLETRKLGNSEAIERICALHEAERQRLERLIESTHEVYKEQLERLKADYTRELNAKLEQINAQAKTIKELIARAQRRKQLGPLRPEYQTPILPQLSEQAFDAKCERGELDRIICETTVDYNEGRATDDALAKVKQ